MDFYQTFPTRLSALCESTLKHCQETAGIQGVEFPCGLCCFFAKFGWCCRGGPQTSWEFITWIFQRCVDLPWTFEPPKKTSWRIIVDKLEGFVMVTYCIFVWWKIFQTFLGNLVSQDYNGTVPQCDSQWHSPLNITPSRWLLVAVVHESIFPNPSICALQSGWIPVPDFQIFQGSLAGGQPSWWNSNCQMGQPARFVRWAKTGTPRAKSILMQVILSNAV